MNNKREYEPENWSPGGQVFYLGDDAWGTLKNGQTVCLGRRGEIEKALEERNHSNPIIQNIITMDYHALGEQNIVKQSRRRKLKK